MPRGSLAVVVCGGTTPFLRQLKVDPYENDSADRTAAIHGIDIESDRQTWHAHLAPPDRNSRPPGS